MATKKPSVKKAAAKKAAAKKAAHTTSSATIDVPAGVVRAMKRCTDRRPITLRYKLNWHHITVGAKRDNLAVELKVEFPTMTCTATELAVELNEKPGHTGDDVCDIVEDHLP